MDLEALATEVGEIAHDLNNSLTSILGLTDWLLYTLPPEAPGRHEMEGVRRAALDTATLVDRLCSLAATRPPGGACQDADIQPAGAVPVPRGTTGPPLGPTDAFPAPLRILLVDDEPEVREAVADMTSALGHRVHTAGSGPEALGVLGRQPFDVLVTDLGMPGMDGRETARRARALVPGLRVLLLTGWTDEAEGEPPADIAAILMKPLTMAVLQAALSPTS